MSGGGVESKSEAINVLVLAFERMADSQAVFVEESRETNKEMVREIKALNREVIELKTIVVQIEGLRESQIEMGKRLGRRVDKIESTQQSGCQYAKEAVSDRNHKMEIVQKDISRLEASSKVHTETLAEIKDIPNKILWKVVMIVVSVVTTGVMASKFIGG